MNFRPILALLLSIAAAAGCKPQDPQPDPQIPPAGQATQAAAQPVASEPIAWIQGDIEAAFEQARAQKKPIFLYWGAQWCPYCSQLQATVFRQREFVAKSRLFVPVYLDGDDPGAQKWGEQFGVSGYPTVVILDPDRNEITRIAGGMDLSVYGDVLDLALGDMRPVRTVLASLEKADAKLSADDCRRLAFHAWSLDERTAADNANTAAALQRAAERCPAGSRVERARLVATAASAASDAEAEAIEAGGKPSPRLAQLVDDVHGIVADRELALAIMDALRALDQDFFEAAERVDAVKGIDLTDKWLAVMDAASSDQRYSEADQLYAVASRLRVIKTIDPKGVIPQMNAEDARRRVDQALARQHDPQTRAAVVNATLHVLDALGDTDRLVKVAEQEMKTSKTPYYYMLELAAIEEKRGNFDAAIAWLERAYRESKGAATRFQWGTSYVRGLVRMRPQDEARIRDAALEVLGELDGPDRLYRRTRTRLESLDASLREWSANGQHPEAIAAIRGRMSEICANIPEAEPAKATCSGFLATT